MLTTEWIPWDGMVAVGYLVNDSRLDSEGWVTAGWIPRGGVLTTEWIPRVGW